MRIRALSAAVAAASLLLAAGQVAAATLEEMAGQMVLVGFQGTAPDDPGVVAVREQIASGEIGGVMYLRTNVDSLSQVQAINDSLLAAAPGPVPFIALDQEGGQIERLTRAVGFEEIPSAARVGAGTREAAEQLYADLATRLAGLGFNLNFGPVADLNRNPDNPIIARYQRSFGADPEAVAAFDAAFVAGHRQAGVATALKHFPGHGSSRGDTHDGFVDVTDVWDPVELAPYRTLIAANLVDMVMVAHLYNADYAGTEGLELPASLSPQWIDGVLRDDLGYDGVVISDDMQMGAIRARFDLSQTVIRSVIAGNDILLFSNTADYDPALGEKIRAILVEQGERSEAFAARIEASYERILAVKQRLGARAQ